MRDPAAEVDRSDGRESLSHLFDLLRRPAWHADALCREFPDLSWYPEQGGDQRAPTEVCDRCLVRAECADAGLGERFGIWGGTNEKRRKELRRLQPRPERSPREPRTYSPVRAWRKSAEAMELFGQRRELVTPLHAAGMGRTQIARVAGTSASVITAVLTPPAPRARRAS